MIGRYLVIVVAAPLLAWAAPVAAQNAELGHIIPIHRGTAPAQIPHEGTSAGDESRRTMNEFAGCTLRRHRRQVVTWLSYQPYSDGAAHLRDEVMDPECLDDGELRFDAVLMRGSLYRALYVDAFERVAPTLQLAPVDPNAVPAASPDPSVQSYNTLLRFADCLVRRDAATSRKIVLGVAGSVQEANDFAALSPQFSLCLAKGTQLKLSKTILAGFLAEALYRASIANPAVASAGASR